jgi:hypothetical protein
MSDEKRIILREANGVAIRQSTRKGYFDATAMCQSHNKAFHDWHRSKTAQEYLIALANETGIPVSELVVSYKGGNVAWQGTWVHPLVANRLAQWCSPAFAITVDKWIEELKQGRYPQAQASDPDVLPILENHEGRLRVLEGSKREPRNRHHDRLLRRAVRRMGGKCPCGCGRQINAQAKWRLCGGSPNRSLE